MRCLVVGGTGFIGSHVADLLSRKGHTVRIMGRTPVGSRMRLSGISEHVHGDISDNELVSQAMSGMDVLFHFASSTVPKTSNEDPLFDVQSNVVSAISMMECAVSCGVSKIVYASSGGTVYGKPMHVPIDEAHPTNPTSSYGIHKLVVEKYLELYRALHGLKYVVLRISNPYGPRQNPANKQGIIAVMLNRAMTSEPVEIWGDGSVIRDYLHVTDVARAAECAMVYDGPSGVFNVGSGVGHSLNELIDIVRDSTGICLKVNYKEARNFDVPVNVLDVSKARIDLGWEPKIGLEEGIGTTFRQMQVLGITHG